MYTLSIVTEIRKAVGLSDHSFGSVVPVLAVGYGAKVIEKHVCLGREIESADAGFSMEMGEFAQMVEDVHNASKAIGRSTYELTDSERKGLGGRRTQKRIMDSGIPFPLKRCRDVRRRICRRHQSVFEK